MKVTGLDFDIRVEGVFVEKHRAASAVGNMKPVFLFGHETFAHGAAC